LGGAGGKEWDRKKSKVGVGNLLKPGFDLKGTDGN